MAERTFALDVHEMAMHHLYFLRDSLRADVAHVEGARARLDIVEVEIRRRNTFRAGPRHTKTGAAHE